MVLVIVIAVVGMTALIYSEPCADLSAVGFLMGVVCEDAILC